MRAFLTALAAAALVAGAASAKPKPASPTATPATPAAAAATSSSPASPATPTVKAAAKPRTAISLDCSKQADAKGLHGKERKAFRRGCMKPAKT